VRFRVPSLSGVGADAALLREKLPALQGVTSVDVTPATGSVLIRYEADRVQPQLLFAATVRLLGLEEELKQTPRPVFVKELRSVVDSLNRIVYDRTGGLLDFHSTLMILLAGVGFKKLFSEGGSAIPPGVTLIWWGMHQLLGHGPGASD
jgi:hypothetical protein